MKSDTGTGEKKVGSSADLLLDAAASLLSDQGVKDVSLSDIAKKSGLNSALIKYYFGNKEGLLLAVLARDANKSMNALRDLVQMPISADQKLKIHINGVVSSYFRSPYLNNLIHYMIEYGEKSSSKRVSEMYVQPMVAAYESIIAQGVEAGIFRPINAGMLYHSLVGACDHIFHAAYSAVDTLGSPQITDEIKQRYVAHVVNIYLAGVLIRP